MFKFFRDAQSELEHVVWPTPNETKKYMVYNIIVIVIVTLLLMVLGYMIRLGLTSFRTLVNDGQVTQTTTTDAVTHDELDDITKALEAKKAQSGATTEQSTTISGEASTAPRQ
jgi:preprotein translocase SecE subunit